jgi:hypothetical protein
MKKLENKKVLLKMNEKLHCRKALELTNEIKIVEGTIGAE